ncbi:MAG: ribonuclease T [Proteobacteria bacterium]|nr:ribonuclease T [Pseudomonadota bacterium]
MSKAMDIKYRFDGFLPIVIDLETSGCVHETDALLELAAFLVDFDENNQLKPGELYHCHIEPFPGARLDPKALAVNRIDPGHPFRFAISESQALLELFAFVRQALKLTGCRRAILTGHNAHFDLSFLQAAIHRCDLKKKSPFHSFACFDTATLAGFVYGKTVLAKALASAYIPFDHNEAHSAIYDAQRTAELFCKMLNETKTKFNQRFQERIVATG